MNPAPDESPWSFSINVSADNVSAGRSAGMPSGSLPPRPAAERAALRLGETVDRLNEALRQWADSEEILRILHATRPDGPLLPMWERCVVRAAGVRAVPSQLGDDAVAALAERSSGIARALNPFFDFLDFRLLSTRSADGLPQLVTASVVNRHLFSDGSHSCPIFQIRSDAPLGMISPALFDIAAGSAHVDVEGLRRLAEEDVARSKFSVDQDAVRRIMEEDLLHTMIEEGCHGVDWARLRRACGYEFHRTAVTHYREVRAGLVRSDGPLSALFRDPAKLSDAEQSVLARTAFELSADLLLGAFGYPDHIARLWTRKLGRFEGQIAPERAIDFSNDTVCYGMVAAFGTMLCGNLAGLWVPRQATLSDPVTVGLLRGTAGSLEQLALRDPLRVRDIFETGRCQALQVPPRSSYSLHPVASQRL